MSARRPAIRAAREERLRRPAGILAIAALALVLAWFASQFVKAADPQPARFAPHRVHGHRLRARISR